MKIFWVLLKTSDLKKSVATIIVIDIGRIYTSCE